MIVVGDKNKFALGCLLSPDDITEGKIYIIIENNNYGSRFGDICLNQFFDNVKYALNSYKPVIPELYGMSTKDVLESIDAIRLDTSADKCPIDQVIGGFFDNPSDVQDEILFYGGFYAFDDLTIVFISDGVKGHLMIRDECDNRVSDVTIGKDELEDSFIKLAALYGNKGDGVNLPK